MSLRLRLALGAAPVLAAAAWLLLRAPSARDEAPPPPVEVPLDIQRAAIAAYAEHLHAAYAEATAGAARLREAVERLLASPSAAALEAAKAAWRDARPAYLRTEIARFAEGPVDGPPDAPERFLNAWPLDEAYIDGLIADPAQPLDRAALREANERGGETHVATGWHAIEYLLWGPDLETGPGGGRRPPEDYVPPGRRGAYLRACAEMLEADLAFLRGQWAPGDPDNYRAWFAAAPPRVALSKMLTGTGTLIYGELRGERIVAPFTLKDREHEHSCFSDTTHLDHVGDMVGVKDVWTAALRGLALAVDPALAAEVERRIDAALEALRDPALDPFEAAILGDDAAPGRRAIQRALDRLSELNRSFCLLAARAGVPIGTTVVR